MTYLLSDTTDSNGYYNYALLALTTEQAHTLLEYNIFYHAVKAGNSNLYCLEFFWPIDWVETIPFDVDPNGEWASVTLKQAQQVKNFASTAADTVKVTQDGCVWSASPKHSDGYFESRELSWADIQAIAAGHEPDLEHVK